MAWSATVTALAACVSALAAYVSGPCASIISDHNERERALERSEQELRVGKESLKREKALLEAEEEGPG